MEKLCWILVEMSRVELGISGKWFEEKLKFGGCVVLCERRRREEVCCKQADRKLVQGRRTAKHCVTFHDNLFLFTSYLALILC